MDNICTWDEVFTRKKQAPNLIFLILYWYLFNKPDYQSNIADKLEKLKEKKEFKDIPDSITKARTITKYIHEMEEYNLIGIKETKRRRDYYQALSFPYIDPFCIKTPKLKASTINEHYEEYKKQIMELGIAKYKKFSDVSSFCASRNNAVIPAQEIFKDFSLNPNTFLRFFFQGKRNYFALNDLIRECFSSLDYLIYYYYEKNKKKIQETSEIQFIDIKKASKIFNYDIPDLIKKYHFIEWYEGIESIDSAKIDEEKIKKYWHELCEHVGTDAFDKAFAIMLIYTDLEFGRITFNKETLKFEGSMTFTTYQ